MSCYLPVASVQSWGRCQHCSPVHPCTCASPASSWPTHQCLLSSSYRMGTHQLQVRLLPCMLLLSAVDKRESMIQHVLGQLISAFGACYIAWERIDFRCASFPTCLCCVQQTQEPMVSQRQRGGMVHTKLSLPAEKMICAQITQIGAQIAIES